MLTTGQVYGQVNAPIYPVQQMDCPSVLIYGGLEPNPNPDPNPMNMGFL